MEIALRNNGYDSKTSAVFLSIVIAWATFFESETTTAAKPWPLSPAKPDSRVNTTKLIYGYYYHHQWHITGTRRQTHGGTAVTDGVSRLLLHGGFVLLTTMCVMGAGQADLLRQSPPGNVQLTPAHRGQCKGFAQTNKCKVRFDRRSKACVCVGT